MKTVIWGKFHLKIINKRLGREWGTHKWWCKIPIYSNRGIYYPSSEGARWQWAVLEGRWYRCDLYRGITTSHLLQMSLVDQSQQQTTQGNSTEDICTFSHSPGHLLDMILHESYKWHWKIKCRERNSYLEALSIIHNLILTLRLPIWSCLYHLHWICSLLAFFLSKGVLGVS